jgi:hypothetical protein
MIPMVRYFHILEYLKLFLKSEEDKIVHTKEFLADRYRRQPKYSSKLLQADDLTPPP